MLSIAAEELVRSLTRERDGHVLRRELAQSEEAERRQIGERLIEVPDQLGQVDGVVDEGKLELVVIRSEVPRYRAGVCQLVLGPGLCEADRERLHRLAHLLRHQGDDQARVEASTQHRPQRDVAHQA